MGKPKTSVIDTVEEEATYAGKVWSKMTTFEKAVLLTITFLYFYVIIVILASYDNLTKSSDPDSGKAIFWLTVITAVIVILPLILHYLGISTFGILHFIGLCGVFTFVATLWLLFEVFEKRELDSNIYKDPYSISLYFLLISFSVIYILANISRKM
jgi:hypothetical protein